MITERNAELLADMLLHAEKELRKPPSEGAKLDPLAENAKRRETYLATVNLWTKSLSVLEQ